MAQISKCGAPKVSFGTLKTRPLIVRCVSQGYDFGRRTCENEIYFAKRKKIALVSGLFAMKGYFEAEIRIEISVNYLLTDREETWLSARNPAPRRSEIRHKFKYSSSAISF